MAKQKRFSFLKDQNDEWVTRPDVVVYDAHRIHNETVAIGKHLTVGKKIGPELMLGHLLGDALDNPVLIIRYGTRSVFHTPGSRSLAHDYSSPSRANEFVNAEGSWDVIHFNFGIWDTYRSPKGSRGWDKENGELWVPLDRYEKNLREMVAKMKKTGATLIWASITAVHDDCPSTRKEDVLRYNEVAAKIMKENGVMINDLHAVCVREGFPKGTNVHSVPAKAMQHATLTVIKDALKKRKTLCKPLPRILTIGDSISGNYAHYVAQELLGKATVYHSPGNAGSTDMGVKHIDEWIPLKNYLLKGQEYMELVDSIKAVLRDPKRFYPDHKGQQFEISGLVWFQGIKDSKLEFTAKEYEANLSGLIKDIRKELEVPNLPVVVAANRHGKLNTDSPKRIVHDAQMAVADPEKHPEFANTVISIDTTPFFRGKEQSPGVIVGGRRALLFYPQRYNNNAETFLLIGEAMGQSMLKLVK